MRQLFVLYRYEKDDKILTSSHSFLNLFLGILVWKNGFCFLKHSSKPACGYKLNCQISNFKRLM